MSEFARIRRFWRDVNKPKSLLFAEIFSWNPYHLLSKSISFAQQIIIICSQNQYHLLSGSKKSADKPPIFPSRNTNYMLFSIFEILDCKNPLSDFLNYNGIAWPPVSIRFILSSMRWLNWALPIPESPLRCPFGHIIHSICYLNIWILHRYDERQERVEP